MDRDHDQRHRCKVCRKTFPCGRSLGGHMRSHLSAANSSSDVEERLQNSRGFQGLGAAGYGLRENPKKTWRLSDSTSDQKEKQCKDCGKEFQSWKALFGHMRCHSEKRAEERDQEVDEDEQEGSWNGGACNEGTVVEVPRKKRRSRRTAAIVASSSSLSEYEKEQEDVAISLMMLSRDVGSWGNGFNPVAESSDKNSVVLEDRDFVSGGCEVKGSELGVLGRGHYKSSLKRLESDDASDDEFKKPKVYASDAEYYLENESDEESRKGSSKKKKKKKKTIFDDSEVGKYNSSIFDAYDTKLGKDAERRSQYECTTCNKTFHSYQALGGHRASHKRIKGCFAPKVDGTENSLEAEASIDQIVGIEDMGKIKGNHECVICGKVFSSGQALGGHKRSHLVMSSPTVVIQQQEEPRVMPDLIDLNLPAPVDEDSSDGKGSAAAAAEFKSWWAGGNLKHEAMVGMISN